VDLDAIWDGECGWSKDGCICVLDRGGDRQTGRDSFGVNLGCPIVTNGDFVA